MNRPLNSGTARIAWSHIAAILYPWRRLLLGVALVVVLGALAEVVPPLIIQRVIDVPLAQRNADGLATLALLYLLAVTTAQFLGFLTNYLTALAAQGALHDLRVRLFDHLQRLPLSYYDQTPLGDSISRCTADIDTVDTLFSSGVAKLMADLVRLITVAGAMILLSLPLSLAAALVVPPLVLVTNFFRVHVRDAERANRHAVGLLNTHLQETFGGVEVIRAFGQEQSFVARFRGALRMALAAYNRATLYASFYPPLMGTLAAIATAFLLWTGTRPWLDAWSISLGTLTAFVLLFRSFFQPITALGDEWQTVQSALSGLERIFAVLSLPAAIEFQQEQTRVQPRPQAVTGVANKPAAIELRDLFFGYQPDQPILHGLSFSVAAGEQVALVGRTGAGKSSILSLLSGLYAPWSGAVCVAGHDPYLLVEDERRRVIGVAPQMTQLFSGSVWENLTLGDQMVALADVVRAATLTGANVLIDALPQGYATVLGGGGNGVQLSAGQRQLLTVTRALVWQPPVLLLDEATAAIDSAGEAALRAALRADGEQRAILIVAHRLATSLNADRVIVLEAGRVIEEGTPAELIRRGGRFAAMLELEAAGWDWRSASAIESFSH